MRNPNRFGTVSKLSGNRRRPYVVREGKTGNQNIIGYAETKEKGIEMLSDYNRNPWDYDAVNITLKELYALWLTRKAPRLSVSLQKSLATAYNCYVSALDNCKYSQLKTYEMQSIIDDCNKKNSTQSSIKNLFYHLDNFAFELDIINKKYSDLLKCKQTEKNKREIFSDAEIATLWNNIKTPWVDSVLILLYSGFRVSELLSLNVQTVNLSEGYMQGGVKTVAGKNRIVPIHHKIEPLVAERLLNSNSGYLIEAENQKLTPSEYRRLFDSALKSFGFKHCPHECRHTFRSRLDSAGANKVCIDKMLGHKTKDVGIDIYTHKGLDELKFNIELVTN